MKLNYKRTFFIGLAFLSICAFWQMYDNIIPLMLQQTFHLNETITGAIMALDNVLAVFLLPILGTISDKVDTPIGKRTPFIIVGTILACVFLYLVGLANARASLAMFIIMLFLLLIAMGLYRSPAVALMPDLTPKPLRSQGNAVINLMGAIGGVYTLVLISLLSKDDNDYMPILLGVIAVMIIAVIVLVLTTREKKIAPLVAKENEEWEALQAKEAAESEDEVIKSAVETAEATESGGELPKDVKKSLFFILLSIALWFTAYNAVTTAWSRYATTVWNMKNGGYANCLMVGTVAACLSYIPIGILAAKIGRKKSILIGLVMLIISYAAVGMYANFSASINVFFVLVGIGWAAVNVNSLPMVVEMCKESDVGKYTGLYYTFSMSAQIVTPILSGALLQYVSYKTLFPYSVFFMVLAFGTMMMVRHGDNKPQKKASKLEYLDVDD
ncbi:Na+/melibiose symporter [Lachnospiraceae bacterium XBB2008]|nr:Na+/melibiose symporter [Lachnospiraceae bacterium XBB2008]